ncbi:hypothetical protein ACHQM5_007737 [Ranunculus cassubicifolius]
MEFHNGHIQCILRIYFIFGSRMKVLLAEPGMSISTQGFTYLMALMMDHFVVRSYFVCISGMISYSNSFVGHLTKL